MKEIENKFISAMRLVISIIITTLMFGMVAVAAPTSDMLVTDNADMLTKDEETKLENALYQIYEQTHIEYVIYLAQSLNGKTIEEASLETGRKLGIGDREDNTGLLIYVALEDKEFRMEVGYGLEGAIPDSQAKKIIDCMTSYFKEKNYADGLLAAVTKTVEILNNSGEYVISQDGEYVVESKDDDIPSVIIVIVFILLLLISLYIDSCSVPYGSYSGSHFSGGSGGSFGGGSFGGGSFGGGGASGGW